MALIEMELDEEAEVECRIQGPHHSQTNGKIAFLAKHRGDPQPFIFCLACGSHPFGEHAPEHVHAE